MGLGSASRDLIKLDYIKVAQEISTRHREAIRRIEQTTQRGGGMQSAIDKELVQMAKELAQAKVQLYLEAFRREEVIPDETDIDKIYREIQQDVRGVSLNPLHPTLASSQDAFMNIPPGARMDLIRETKRMRLDQRRRARSEEMAQAPATPASPNLSFIAEERIAELRSIQNSSFDLRKVVRFCEELNISYGADCYLAVAFLVRALLDHVPPIFGKNTFSEVANNYAGKSVKDQLQRLDNAARKVADAHLHQSIRSTETLPTAQQVSFSAELDVLLSEVIRELK